MRDVRTPPDKCGAERWFLLIISREGSFFLGVLVKSGSYLGSVLGLLTLGSSLWQLSREVPPGSGARSPHIRFMYGSYVNTAGFMRVVLNCPRRVPTPSS